MPIFYEPDRLLKNTHCSTCKRSKAISPLIKSIS